MNMSVFFVDCPKIPFWSVLSLSCCRLFKIYTSYSISKCRSVKMINIPWFWVPHLYLLLDQSYKRLKLRAFKEWLLSKTNGRQICVVKINTFTNILMFILRELKDIVYLQKKLPLWAAQKWLFHSAYFCDWGMKKYVFCEINFCDVGILWKKCRIYFCNPNILTKFIQRSLKNSIYGNNLCLS